MKDALILEGKNYISAKRAALVFGYTSDYVGQMCREGKLDCKMVGRTWFVKEESVEAHKLENSEFTIPVIAPAVVVAPVQTQTETLVEKIPSDHPISFVPKVFALPYSISHTFLSPPPCARKTVKPIFSLFTKISLFSGIFLIAFIFIFQATLINFFSESLFSSNTTTASLASLSQDILGKIISSISSIPTLVINLFKKEEIKIAKINMTAEKPPPSFNALAVVPSSNSAGQDEVIKQKIRDSFSDEVQVKPDKSGTSGIITPVFKKAKGDNFVYVLVPVTN